MSRTARQAEDVATAADLLALAEPVRRAVQVRISVEHWSLPAADVDDVVQETLARVWEVRWRLERATLLAYALVVARNLVTAVERQGRLRARYGPRLVEPEVVADPEADLLLAEERAAVVRALARMRADDRSLLLAHEVRGVEVREIAAEQSVAANTVAVRLRRARARLRVEHLVALRHLTLPTARCRGVLEAISLGDRSRQRRLLAAEHLVQCAVCAELAEPLARRRRSLTALAPVALLLALPGWLWGWARANPLSATGAGTATTAVAVAVGVLVTRDQAPPAPRPPAAVAIPATVSVGGSRVLPAARVGSLAGDVGRAAVARDVRVQSVPADEGFWVGAGPGQRVWVQLRTSAESRVRVRPGERASFTGIVVRVTAGMPADVGLTAAEGAAELRAQGAYLLVEPRRLSVH